MLFCALGLRVRLLASFGVRYFVAEFVRDGCLGVLSCRKANRVLGRLSLCRLWTSTLSRWWTSLSALGCLVTMFSCGFVLSALTIMASCFSLIGVRATLIIFLASCIMVLVTR